jgi:hypothetical protein
MTATNPIQLHLFDAAPNHDTIPPDRRQRLLTLTGVLLSEAARAKTGIVAHETGPFPARETEDE